METCEIVILGGGAAGLAALHKLQAAGQSAILLEARRRLGGRVHTLHPEGWPLPVEVGAEFIHGAAPEWRGQIGRGDDRDATRAWNFGCDGLHLAGEFAGGSDAVFERLQARAATEADCSFADFLSTCADLPGAARRGALAYIEGYEAADPARVSVRALQREMAVEEAGAGWPLRPRGGYDAVLPRPSAEGVRQGTRVRAVRWRPGAVEVAAEQAGSEVLVRARCCIVALPLAVLQTDAVRFDPPLEAKAWALEHLVAGAARRLTLRLRAPVWQQVRDRDGHRLDDLGFLFSRESGPFPVWWAQELAGAAQITGWAGGRQALALSGEPEASLTARAVAELTALLGHAPDVIAAHTHDWATDPLALGAYSYAAVGGADAFAALAEPVAATLYFAGEATDATGHHATVPGAVHSGRRAADEVLAGGK